MRWHWKVVSSPSRTASWQSITAYRRGSISFETEKEQLKKLSLEKDAAMKAILHVSRIWWRKLLHWKQRKRLSQNLTMNYFLLQLRKRLRLSPRKTVLLKLSSQYLRDLLITSRKRLCRTVTEKFLSLFHFTSELQRNLPRRGENVHELWVPREDETLFSLGYLFHFCFLHTEYAPLILSAEQGLH